MVFFSNPFMRKLQLCITSILKSIVKFIKSSILSLIVLCIMFFLLTKMEQAAAMVINLVEHDILSLLVSFLLINVLAFSLSHYPIYTYYSANLNHRKDMFLWEPKTILGFIRVTVFESKFTKPYTFNLVANILRYSNGLMVFVIWGCILIYGFEKNLLYDKSWTNGLYWLVVLSSISALVGYGVLKYYKFKYQEDIIRIDLKLRTDNGVTTTRNRRLNYCLSWSFLIFSILFFLCIGILIYLTTNNIGFSKLGLSLLLFANFWLTLLYFNFRLIRSEIRSIINYIDENKKSKLVRYYIRLFQFAQKPERYLGILIIAFLVALMFLIVSHFSAINNGDIANGIPILLAYLYCYSFVIFSIFKFFFVTRNKFKQHYKEDTFMPIKFRRIRWIISIVLLLIMYIFIKGAQGESVTHQLSLVSVHKFDKLYDVNLINDIKLKPDSVMFFIAAQGGGLKGNFWTLNILNKLQALTKDGLINSTIAVSGASGGSLALGLYTLLYKEHGSKTGLIQDKINTIVKGNYTSVDLSLMFGWDFLRKAYPLNLYAGSKDRAYYKMRMYQNVISENNASELLSQDFRSLWAEVYDKYQYFPSLIMNTSSVKGKRGVFWSHQPTTNFTNIFPNAEDLLYSTDTTKAISYYQAVSTTNRFPLLSPAAKIKGKGHYIDAGAIDNGGLMGCIDLYRYLKVKGALKGKKIVFIEIMNGSSTYTNHIIKSLEHLPEINEDESSTFEADIMAGVNLDKIPEYLRGVVYNLAQNHVNIDYVPIYLPHRTSLKDVEERLGGEIINDSDKNDVLAALTKSNNIISDSTEYKKGFSEPWRYTELPLSRHLSGSNIAFGMKMLNHPEVLAQLKKIQKYLE